MAALKAAVAAGADAVYIGGKRFGARAYAGNFDTEEIQEAVKVCHSHGVKLYVTLNTLLYEKELSEACEFAKTAVSIGVDALIVCDLGLISLLREALPNAELHASTQMGIHNLAGADFAYSLGCKRVVLARECSAADIKKITEECKAETEIFVHGALCVCHSGQCLFSSMVGGRSGNRGECAQPCRLPFEKGRYPLSLKDISLAAHIPDIIASGVSSFKIEGRMKSAEYVYTVTKIYRKLLDEGRSATALEIAQLEMAFSRGGFTDAYYVNKKQSAMTGIRSEGDKAASRNLLTEIPEPAKVKIRAEAKFCLGEPSKLRFIMNPVSNIWGKDGERTEISVEVSGAIPTEAKNAPLTQAGVAERLSKMGATRFSLAEEDIMLEVESNINLSPSEINALRRSAAEALDERLAAPFDAISGCKEEIREPDIFKTVTSKTKEKAKGRAVVVFSNSATVAELLQSGYPLEKFYKVFLPLGEKVETYRLVADDVGENALGVILPAVVSESEFNDFRQMLKDAKEAGVKTALVANLGQIDICLSLGFSLFADTRLNVLNSRSRDFLESRGFSQVALSQELTLPQARDIGGYAFTLGRVPLMVTERCFIKENFGCKSCGKSAFTDRLGASFPVLKEYGHRNIILNSALTYMGDKRKDIAGSLKLGEYLYFSCENGEEVERLLNSYFEERSLPVPVRRMGKRQKK